MNTPDLVSVNASQVSSQAAPARLSIERRLPELDGIRGLAIVMVLVAHYISRDLEVTPGSLADRANSMLALLWSGVDLFFVLSGFLIGGILIDVKTSPNYFKTFYVRRIFRIFPLYYLSLVVFITAVCLDASAGGPALQWLFGGPLPLWTYPLFLQNFATAALKDYGPYWVNITWSLAIEEQFYLILPILVRFCSLRWVVRVVATSVVLAPILRILLWRMSPDGFVAAYVLMPCRADSLGMGVLAAILVRQPAAWSWLKKNVRLLYVFLSLLGGGVLALMLKRYGQASLAMNSVGYSGLALTFVTLLLVSVAAPQSMLGTIFRSKVLRIFGLYSYFIYVFHQPILGLVQHVLLNRAPALGDWASAGATFVAFLTVMGAAALSWKLFESPLVRRGHRIVYGPLR